MSKTYQDRTVPFSSANSSDSDQAGSSSPFSQASFHSDYSRPADRSEGSYGNPFEQAAPAEPTSPFPSSANFSSSSFGNQAFSSLQQPDAKKTQPDQNAGAPDNQDPSCSDFISNEDTLLAFSSYSSPTSTNAEDLNASNGCFAQGAFSGPVHFGSAPTMPAPSPKNPDTPPQFSDENLTDGIPQTGWNPGSNAEEDSSSSSSSEDATSLLRTDSEPKSSPGSFFASSGAVPGASRPDSGQFQPGFSASRSYGPYNSNPEYDPYKTVLFDKDHDPEAGTAILSQENSERPENISFSSSPSDETSFLQNDQQQYGNSYQDMNFSMYNQAGSDDDYDPVTMPMPDISLNDGGSHSSFVEASMADTTILENNAKWRNGRNDAFRQHESRKEGSSSRQEADEMPTALHQDFAEDDVDTQLLNEPEPPKEKNIRIATESKMKEAPGQLILENSSTGQLITITRAATLVGSGEICDWQLFETKGSSTVDPQHAWITYEGSKVAWTIQDMSRFGTSVNGRRTDPRYFMILHDGDRIQFGESSVYLVRRAQHH